MSLYVDLHADRYGGLIVDPIDVIVDMVGSGSILVGYLSIIMSKITVARDCELHLQLRGGVQVYISWAWPSCKYLVLSCHLLKLASGHFSHPRVYG
jgi:hypothetical protein